MTSRLAAPVVVDITFDATLPQCELGVDHSGGVERGEMIEADRTEGGDEDVPAIASTTTETSQPKTLSGS